MTEVSLASTSVAFPWLITLGSGEATRRAKVGTGAGGAEEGDEDGALDGESEVGVEEIAGGTLEADGGYEGADDGADVGFDSGAELVGTVYSGPRTTASQDPALYPNLMKLSLPQITAIKVVPSTVTTKFFCPSRENTSVTPSAGTVLGKTRYR